MIKQVLYSFRRCPYAIRARWSLLLSGIVVNYREVDLKNKPTQLLKASPKGTVPVLITSQGQVLDESIEIMKWALSKKNPFDGLRYSDNYAQKKIQSLIEQNDFSFKPHLDRFKYSTRYNRSDKNNERKLAREVLLEWSNRINKNSLEGQRGWLVGNTQSLADWAIWPFVRQYKIADPVGFENDKELKPLSKWLYFYISHELYKPLMAKFSPWKPGDIPTEYPSSSETIK